VRVTERKRRNEEGEKGDKGSGWNKKEKGKGS